MIWWTGLEQIFLYCPKKRMGIQYRCAVVKMQCFLWAMQYNTNVEIIEPISLREKIGERAREMAEKYGK